MAKQKPMSLAEAFEKLGALARAHPIAGQTEDFDPKKSAMFGTGSIRWERGWGIDAWLHVSWRVGEQSLRVEVNTSTCHRSVAEALAFVTLFEQVTRFAALVESVLGREVVDPRLET